MVVVKWMLVWRGGQDLKLVSSWKACESQHGKAGNAADSLSEERAGGLDQKQQGSAVWEHLWRLFVMMLLPVNHMPYYVLM